MEKVVFLVGFMGSGKSYWGRRLADALGYQFTDLDHFIEAAEKASIRELFEQKGEAVFRELERDYLRKLPLHIPSVIATGGGTPCYFDNMEWMNSHGKTIWLDVPVHILAARLWRGKAKRPLLADVQEIDFDNFIKERLEIRIPFYAGAMQIIKWNEDPVHYLEMLKSL